MKKISKREMFEAIKAAMEDGETTIHPDLIVEFCEKEIEALDKKAAKAKETAAKKKAEGDELTEKVFEALTDEFECIACVTEKVGDEEATTAKVQYRLGQLVKAGRAEKEEITIESEDGKKRRRVMGYKRCG